MRKILLSAAAAASLFALPAFAADGLSSDPEIRQWQEYRQLVDKAEAYRFAHEPGSAAIQGGAGDVAAVKPGIGTDAQQAPAYRGPQPATGRYNSIQDYWQDR